MVGKENNKNKFQATTTQGPKCLKVKNWLIKMRVKEAGSSSLELLKVLGRMTSVNFSMLTSSPLPPATPPPATLHSQRVLFCALNQFCQFSFPVFSPFFVVVAVVVLPCICCMIPNDEIVFSVQLSPLTASKKTFFRIFSYQSIYRKRIYAELSSYKQTYLFQNKLCIHRISSSRLPFSLFYFYLFFFI